MAPGAAQGDGDDAGGCVGDDRSARFSARESALSREKAPGFRRCQRPRGDQVSIVVSRPIWKLAARKGFRRTVRAVLRDADVVLRRRERWGYAAGRPATEKREVGGSMNRWRSRAGKEQT
jgi:hypothetical protein